MQGKNRSERHATRRLALPRWRGANHSTNRACAGGYSAICKSSRFTAGWLSIGHRLHENIAVGRILDSPHHRCNPSKVGLAKRNGRATFIADAPTFDGSQQWCRRAIVRTGEQMMFLNHLFAGSVEQTRSIAHQGAWMHIVWRRSGLSLCVLVLRAMPLHAQANVVVIDATTADEPVHAVAAKLGTSRNPAGHTIGVNSQSLVFDGKPWIPVMGELHYSRVPESRWEEDILRMKSAGVTIVSSYVIWIHHEQDDSHFIWTGNKDLRRFAELCSRHGMYFYPRIGPWAHGEVRNGGLPDWVAAQEHTRENEARYLKEVNTFYQQIGEQLKGLYWKDGGSIIGLQIENEYRATGPGKGSEHIRTLKTMALAAGMDVPLYTVTGWDGAAIPLDATLPVFGGYVDAPWDGSPEALPHPRSTHFVLTIVRRETWEPSAAIARALPPLIRELRFLPLRLEEALRTRTFAGRSCPAMISLPSFP